MAYNHNLPAGTYRARALRADCYPTNNGEGLMLGVEWEITQGEYAGSSVSGSICLIDSSGNLTKTYAEVREWAKTWNGIDTDYFKTHCDEWDVEIVTYRRTFEYNGETREVPDVRYVNAPNGRHGGNFKSGDHRTLSVKFGAKLRAAAAQTARSSAPVAKPSVPATAMPSPASVASLSAEQLMREAWEAFKAHNDGLDYELLKSRWFDMLKTHYTGSDIRHAPAEVWKKVIAELNSDLPF